MPVNPQDICSHGRPNHQDLIAELHEELYGSSWARTASPVAVWTELLTRVRELNAEVVQLRAALAAQPQALFEAIVKTTMPSSLHMDGTYPVTLAAWADTETLRRVKGQRVVVYPAVAGSATPTRRSHPIGCCCNTCMNYQPVAGSATPTGDNE